MPIYTFRFGLVGAVDQQMTLIAEDLNSIIEHINGIAATSDMNNPVSVTLGVKLLSRGIALVPIFVCYEEFFSSGGSDVTYLKRTCGVTSVDRASNR